LPAITSVAGRVVYNSRGSEAVEVDIAVEGGFRGRACAPSGASVGAAEAVSLPQGGAAEAVRLLREGAGRIEGADAGDVEAVHSALRSLDGTPNWSTVGGSVAYAVSVAAAEAGAGAQGVGLYESLGGADGARFPYPLGNVLGGGAHAGAGTPDIQEVLVCPVGAASVDGAVAANVAVHAELGRVLRERDTGFTGGRSDEGGWAPRIGNEEALEAAARACERLGHTLGREVALGVDFASSTQWDAARGAYVYGRSGDVRTPGEQADFAASLIEKYRLVYAEDAVHEDAFEEMAGLTARFPGTLVTGDDLTATSAERARRAAQSRSCSGAILKVNQAGTLRDALAFAREASRAGIALVTSHRSGESVDSHISHIAVATRSAMLKTGVLGGERVAKLNELLRMSGQGIIQGMADLGALR